MEEETVIITKEEYKELLESNKFLEQLMSLGVDNWDGYELAQERMDW